MKKESKVAWLKTDPWNQQLLEQLKSGGNVEHSRMLEAVADPDHQKVFDPHSANPLKKENHVIFQYSVFLQRPDGKVAIFERARTEQGQQRITPRISFLLSNSTPDTPYDAVPRIIAHQLFVGTRKKITGITPCGIVWNPLPDKEPGQARPTYLFAVYRHEFPEDVLLHGRFKESPDLFVDWVSPGDLAKLTRRSGYIDQLLAGQIARGNRESEIDPDDGIVFAADSRLVSTNNPLDSFHTSDYSYGHNVFVSHASEDSFSAYALYRFLMDESSRSIFATMDLEHVQDGESLKKLNRLIEDCDGVVLVITPSLLAKNERLKLEGKKNWVEWEIELAKSLNKPIIGFKLGTMGRPDYLPDDLVVNNKAAYSDWLIEVQKLVARVQTVFNR